jgi:hypothetical protein
MSLRGVILLGLLPRGLCYYPLFSSSDITSFNGLAGEHWSHPSELSREQSYHRMD